MARYGPRHRHRGRPKKAKRYDIAVASEQEFQALLAKQEMEDEEFRQKRVDEAVTSALTTLAKKNKPHLNMPPALKVPLKYIEAGDDFDQEYFDPYGGVEEIPIPKPKPTGKKKPKPTVKTVDTNVTRRINLDE